MVSKQIAPQSMIPDPYRASAKWTPVFRKDRAALKSESAIFHRALAG
jgi:hypothetical protein